MNLTAKLCLAAAFALGAGAAQASTITDVTGDPTFVNYSAQGAGSGGSYGLEVRGGRQGRADWEIGVGVGTSRSGSFDQGEMSWGTTLLDFSYDYGVTTANEASVTIDGKTVDYDFGTMLFGNALRIFVNRDAILNLDTVDGESVSYTIGREIADWNRSNGGTTLLLGSEHFLDGFTLEGTIAISNGRGSANLVSVTAGNIAPPPIPLPAAGWMLIAGIGGLAALRRRGKAAA